MLRFGQAAAVVISDVSDDGYLRRSETGQLAVLDQIGPMLMMAGVRDKIADVVKKRRRGEQPPVLAAERMQRAQFIKQLLGQVSHPASVLQVGPTVTRESQRPSQARVAFQPRGRGGNRLDAPRQMGDDHAFTQRPVARDQLVNFQRLHQDFEQLAARDYDLGALAIESRDSYAIVERVGGQLFVERPQLVEPQRVFETTASHPPAVRREPPSQAERGEGVDRARGSVASFNAGGFDFGRAMRDNFAQFRAKEAQLFLSDRV